MRLIICTVGTSIANGCPVLRSYQQRASSWDEAAEDLSAEITAKLTQTDLASTETVRRVSAELNSLQRLGLDKSDRVVLLTTDTADGRCCAEHLRRALSGAFPITEDAIAIRRVEGLQVRNAKRLREEGLPNLVRLVMDYRDQWNAEQIVLNPTGGFKGVVPFLTVLGMVFRFRTVYVFEFAEELISLPPLPLSFDAGVLERALPALQRIGREGAVPESDYWARIAGFQPHERDLFLAFVERDGQGYVTLSPLIEPFLPQAPETKAIYLSGQVTELVEKAEGGDRARLKTLLARVANPLWRSMHYHHFANTDLDVFKPGNVAERAACIFENGEVFVCRLYLSHDDYDATLARLSRRDFDLSTFSQYVPPPLEECVEAEQRENEEEVQRLRDENRQLRAKITEMTSSKKPSAGRGTPARRALGPRGVAGGRPVSQRRPRKKLEPRTTLREGDTVQCDVERVLPSGAVKLVVAGDRGWQGTFYRSNRVAVPPLSQCSPGARFPCTVRRIPDPTSVLFAWRDPQACVTPTAPSTSAERHGPQDMDEGEFPERGQTVRCSIIDIDSEGGLTVYAVDYGPMSKGRLHERSPVPDSPCVGDELVCRVRLGWRKSMVYVWLPDGVPDDVEAADRDSGGDS